MNLKYIFKQTYLVFFFIFCFTSLYGQENNLEKELLEELKSAKSDTARIRIYSKLSKLYTGYDPEKKKKISFELKSFAQKINNDTTEIQAIIDIGMSYAILNQRDSAVYYFKWGNERAKKGNHYNAVGRSYVNLGYVFEQLNNTQISIEYYKEAIRYFKKTNYIKGLAHAYMNIGGILFDSDYVKISEEYFKEAHAIFLQTNNEIGLSNTYCGFGNFYRTKKDYEKSLSNYQISLDLAKKNLNKTREAIALWGMSKLFREYNEFSKAVKFCKEAHSICEESKNYFVKNHITLTLIDIYNDMNDMPNAYHYIEIAINEAKQLDKNLLLAAVYLKKADVLYKDKKYKEASNYYKKYNEISKIIENENITQQLYLSEVNRFKGEAEELINDNQKISTKISEYFKTIIIIFIFLICVIILSLLLIKKNYEKIEANKLLTKQKRDISSANEQLNLLNEKLKKQVEIIEKQNQELDQINKVKTKFFSIISHDMRGPLANLHMLIEMYKNDQLTHAELHELFSHIDKSIIDTRSFLDNLLEWSKNQLDGVKVNPEKFDLSIIINKNLSLNSSQLLSKNIIVYNQIETGSFAFADPNMIDVVVRNLLSNSIKFCSSNDSITLKVNDKVDFVEFQISDTGVGISKETANNLFEIVNSKSVGTSGEIGHRIGLILCKDMIELNGGSIRLESEENVGTSFYVLIPKLEQI